MRWIWSLTMLMAATASSAAEPSRSALFCPGVIQFVGAAAPEGGVRTALFYPMGMNADVIDMYAPMESSPHDDAADVFYERVAWRTHYDRYDDFAARLGDCLRDRPRFKTKRPPVPRGAFALNAVDRRSGRQVSIEGNLDVCPDAVRDQAKRAGEICVLLTVRGK